MRAEEKNDDCDLGDDAEDDDDGEDDVEDDENDQNWSVFVFESKALTWTVLIEKIIDRGRKKERERKM